MGSSINISWFIVDWILNYKPSKNWLRTIAVTLHECLTEVIIFLAPIFTVAEYFRFGELLILIIFNGYINNL